MSYPPPDPNQYAIGGQKFWRLNTLLTSDGDIYESEQGSSGFAIGPDSDISKVNIAYFDDQIDGFMNQVAISPQRPFAGTMYARNDAVYAPSSVPGRFLIWPDELFNAAYQPGTITDFTRLDRIVPVLDVVQYFNPIGLNAGRNDKEYEYQVVPFETGVIAQWIVLIPFYGRRYASVVVENSDAAAAHLTCTPGGVTYTMGGGIEREFAAKAIDLTPNTAGSIIIRSSTEGMFDALQLRFGGGRADGAMMTDVAIRVRTSDTEV